MPQVPNVRFVRRLPLARGGPYVTVQVVPLDREHARWWHLNIQPLIDTSITRELEQMRVTGVRRDVRADFEWNWPWILAATSLFVAQGPRAYCVLVPGDGPDGFVPCAMVALVRNIRAFDVARARSAFLWYLADAPQDALRRFVEQPPKLIGKTGLDTALCEAFMAGHQGRLALHADEAGGAKLLAWYHSQGMVGYPKRKPLPFLFRGRVVASNDGRYLFYTPETARAALADHDEYRKKV